jgi:hypothetical protein
LARGRELQAVRTIIPQTTRPRPDKIPFGKSPCPFRGTALGTKADQLEKVVLHQKARAETDLLYGLGEIFLGRKLFCLAAAPTDNGMAVARAGCQIPMASVGAMHAADPSVLFEQC